VDVTRAHLGDACSITDIAFAKVIASHGDRCAVGLKPHGMNAACGHVDNSTPVVNIALPVEVISRGD